MKLVRIETRAETFPYIVMKRKCVEPNGDASAALEDVKFYLLSTLIHCLLRLKELRALFGVMFCTR
jgi:hypothetical protein